MKLLSVVVQESYPFRESLVILADLLPNISDALAEGKAILFPVDRNIGSATPYLRGKS